MDVHVSRTNPHAIAKLRERYCREMSAQIVHYSWLSRGFSDPYALRVGDELVGYGLVGGVGSEPRRTVTEFYILPESQRDGTSLFQRMMEVSGGDAVLSQTNDALLTRMLHEHATSVKEMAVLFEQGTTTGLTKPFGDIVFRRIDPAEVEGVFAHELEPIGEWGIALDGRIVATGGLLHHYNPPFSDLFMEVDQPCRHRGIGSYLVQELKRVCSGMGRIPAARCSPANEASRACLEKAGMRPCARVLHGVVRLA